MFACLAGILVALGGCATGPTAVARDPFEPVNRQVMKFNDVFDAVVLKPGATIYRETVPPLVRTGVSNFFGNLTDVWSFVNSVLQLKMQDAADNFTRVQLNTFFGLGGIFDIASEFDIDRHREDFGQTLGRWGMPRRAVPGAAVFRSLHPARYDRLAAGPQGRPRAPRGPLGLARRAGRAARGGRPVTTCCAPAQSWTRRRWTNTASPATPICKGGAPRSTRQPADDGGKEPQDAGQDPEDGEPP